MTQRRTPSGQGPARRPGRPGRGGARASARDSGVRGAASRAPSSARGANVPRSANRPAAARRGAAKRTQAPQPRRFTGRATVLCAVLVALALAYTYPVRVYLSQQSEIAKMEAAQAEQRKLVGQLSDEAAMWQDPAYVRIQARQRLYMGPPGEVLLVVLSDPDGAARDAGIDPDAAKKQAPDPWYGTLWSSIRAANDEGAFP
jgi:cell division protein FtsB